LRYAWDQAKNLRNQQDHSGVAFELAALVFEDEACLVAPDRIDRVRESSVGTQSARFGMNQELQPCCLWFTFIGRNTMAKTLSASSQPARLKSMKSEDIKNRRLTDRESQTLQAIAARQTARDNSQINFKGIPRLTNRQLRAMVRFRAVRLPKRAVSVRLDEHVLVWLKSKGGGHLTLINDILTNLMEAELAGRDH
jgi:uncharacterized protein (DUF4415 family)